MIVNNKHGQLTYITFYVVSYFTVVVSEMIPTLRATVYNKSSVKQSDKSELSQVINTGFIEYVKLVMFSSEDEETSKGC